MSAAPQAYASCKAIIDAEYGSSTNPMTPNILTHGGVLHGDFPWAAEIATGGGIMPGTKLVGVSVVVVNPDGTTSRSSSLSACFSGTDVNTLTDQALDYLGKLDTLVRLDPACEIAHRLGREAGIAAGSWVVDGNTSDADKLRLIHGVEDGDPEILDQLPANPLSGEWADGWTPEQVVYSVRDEMTIGVLDGEQVASLLDAFEAGFSEGVSDEVVRSARAMLGEEVGA